MKKIYILRHGIPDYEHDSLTNDGMEQCERIKQRLPPFSLVYSSPKGRAIVTARLLSGQEPTITESCSVIPMSAQQQQNLFDAGKQKRFGIAEAIMTNENALQAAKKRAYTTIQLIEDITGKLESDGSALIVSHDGIIAVVEKMLKKELMVCTHSFAPLEGIIIDEFGNVEILRW